MTDAPDTNDHRSAKAQAKASKAHAKAMRPWFKKKRYLGLIGFVVLIGLIAVSSGGGEDGTTDVASDDNETVESDDNQSDANESRSSDGGSSNSANPPSADVTVDSCDVDDTIGTVTANLSILNNSSGRSNYLITVSFEDGDGVKVGDGFASANNLEPGQKARVEAVAFEEADGMTCVVTEVNRFASS